MAIDVLSKLNTGGSGLNISELSETLSAAEIEPRKALISDRVDKAEMGLSGYERLRAQVETLGEAMTMMKGLSPRQVGSDSAAVSVELDDPNALDDTASTIAVTKLAKSQVLRFNNFTAGDQEIGAGTVTVAFGAWSGDVPPVFTESDKTAQSITFAAGSTLADMAEALNMLEGVTARVIDVGDGTFALGVISETGAENALRFTVAPDADPAMQAFDFSADPTPVLVQGAEDAELSINGIAVTRASNEISDLIPGMTITLRAETTSDATISVYPNVEGSLAVMQSFVDMINATTSLVKSLTSRGFGTAGEKGDLMGDALTEGINRQITSIIGQAFGKTGLHLADLGVATERDGSLRLDEALFTRKITANPALMDDMIRDSLEAENGITMVGRPADGVPGAEFRLLRNSLTGEATLNGQPIKGFEQPDGSWSYYVSQGDLKGVKLTIPAGVETATIKHAPSLVTGLKAYLDDVLDGEVSISAREATLQAAMSKDEAALEDLDKRAEELQARYLSRFTEMERIITTLNSTSEYLTNLIDAWNSDN